MNEEDPGFHVDEIDDWIEETETTSWEGHPNAVADAVRLLTVAVYRIGGMIVQRLDEIDATLQEDMDDDDDD